jgi:membrane protease YdiL (CAAX protease family)
MRTKSEARRGLRIYFIVLIALSATFEGWIITHGGLGGPYGALVLPLMYSPLIASVVARLVGREGFADISFRWGGITGTRAALAAWLLPLFVGFVAYGIAWAAGLAHFTPPESTGFAGFAAPFVRLLAFIGRALTIGTVLSCLSAFGEEVGWRGYMVPRLVEAEAPAPYLTSALIWCFWHVPLILWGGYAVGPYPLLSALLFIAVVTPAGLLYARWRMASGSVWPCVIAHGSWNVLIQSVFDRFTTGEGSALWIGESGILTVAAVWIVFLVIRNARWAGMVPAAPARLNPTARLADTPVA